jgi:hypothetical protein
MVINKVLNFANINLEEVMNIHTVLGDSIVFNFVLYGIDITHCAIRGEVYDLNTSLRMANSLGGAQSAPEIVVTDGPNGKFTATLATGLTSTFQAYGAIEFRVVDPSGLQTTIFQQAIHLSPQRIIWNIEDQGVNADTGQNPLF